MLSHKSPKILIIMAVKAATWIYLYLIPSFIIIFILEKTRCWLSRYPSLTDANSNSKTKLVSITPGTRERRAWIERSSQIVERYWTSVEIIKWLTLATREQFELIERFIEFIQRFSWAPR